MYKEKSSAIGLFKANDFLCFVVDLVFSRILRVCGGSGSKSDSCQTCGGSGSYSVTCSTCGGNGYYYTSSTCSSCSGNGGRYSYSSLGTGSVDKTGASLDENGKVLYNNKVKLIATPKDQNVFVGWYNGSTLLSTAQTYTYTVTDHVTITGKFYKVTIPTSSNGDVNVTRIDNTHKNKIQRIFYED